MLEILYFSSIITLDLILYSMLIIMYMFTFNYCIPWDIRHSNRLSLMYNNIKKKLEDIDWLIEYNYCIPWDNQFIWFMLMSFWFMLLIFWAAENLRQPFMSSNSRNIG